MKLEAKIFSHLPPVFDPTYEKKMLNVHYLNIYTNE